MKISPLLLASAYAAPGDRTFVNGAEGQEFLAVGSEDWWSEAVEPRYIAKTEAGIPAMVQAFKDAAIADPARALRINKIAKRFGSQMNRLIGQMKESLRRCRKSAGRKRRSPSERGYQYGDLDADFGEGLWWQMAKWTRNSMWEDCPDIAWPLLARIDRFRWIYNRHYCDFVDSDKYSGNCEWALWHKNGDKRKNDFRQKQWFKNAFGGAENGVMVTPAVITIDPYPLPEGYESTDTAWGTVYYKIHDGLHNINEARALCAADADFLHLPIPTNSYENDFFFNLVGGAQSGKDLWLGISDEQSEGVWLGDNGVEQSWFNWRKGEPNNYKNGEHWVEMILSGNDSQNGLWNDYFLSAVASERGIAYSTNNIAVCTFTVPGTAPPSRCPMGFEEQDLTDGGATCVQVNNGKFQIQYAFDSCAAQGANLAVPTNADDNKLFADLVGYNKGYDLWVGISDVATEGNNRSNVYRNGHFWPHRSFVTISTGKIGC